MEISFVVLHVCMNRQQSAPIERRRVIYSTTHGRWMGKGWASRIWGQLQ